MKKLYSLTVVLILACPFHTGMATEKRTLITTFSGHGLFSCFFAVLNNIRWCEKNGVTPVVDWMRDRHSNYYQKEGYNGSTQPWEYYFEPISAPTEKVGRLQQGTMIYNGYCAPDGSGIPVTTRHSKDYKRTFEKEYRRSIYQTITEYITIKPVITQKVEQFYQDTMIGKTTVGIHMRGTDKSAEVRPVSVEEVCEAANNCAQGLVGCQFLMATDEERLLTEAKGLLNGPVISYNAQRSLDGKPVHKWVKSGPKAQLGEEVLIEVLLLSRCNAFVHTCSNVSSAVLFFNPELDSRFVG